MPSLVHRYDANANKCRSQCKLLSGRRQTRRAKVTQTQLKSFSKMADKSRSCHQLVWLTRTAQKQMQIQAKMQGKTRELATSAIQTQVQATCKRMEISPFLTLIITLAYCPCVVLFFLAFAFSYVSHLPTWSKSLQVLTYEGS